MMLASATKMGVSGQGSGRVLTAADEGYAAACACWNLSVEHRPAAVVSAGSAEDVIAAVRLARERGLGIGVQGTGHGAAVACDGGVLVNTSRMKGVEIDPVRRTARVRAGTVWSEVIAAAHEVGLAPLSGSSPGVGVVGYTLGGGTGWLARRYGHAADSVQSLEVVTADGTLVEASATSHPELFWALRGGGGSFGIVTALEFSLYPVTHVYGGGLFYALEDAAAVASVYSEWVNTVPEELTSRLALLNVPPLPFLPEPIRGRWVIAVQGCLIGSEQQGRDLFRPFRSCARPLLDTYATIPYTAIGSIASDPVDPLASAHSGGLLRAFPAEAVESLAAGVRGREHAALKLVEIRHLGGAMSRPPAVPSAVGHRDASFWAMGIACVGGQASHSTARDEVMAVRAALQCWSDGGALLNGLDSDDIKSVRKAYSAANYGRLESVKCQYDPDNVFRFHLNVPNVNSTVTG